MLKTDKNYGIPFFEINCDNCGVEFQDAEGDTLFPSKEELIKEINNTEWYVGSNNVHYCESCNIN